MTWYVLSCTDDHLAPEGSRTKSKHLINRRLVVKDALLNFEKISLREWVIIGVRHDQHLSKEDVPAYTDLSNF
jgi:hypothetical protein